jgi:hypothetical protein
MSEEYKEGDLVEVIATGIVSQKTASGYVVTIHGVDVPFVQLKPPAQEIAQQILEMIDRTEQEIHQSMQILSNDARAYDGMNRLTVLKNDIKELCEKEIDHDSTTTT